MKTRRFLAILGFAACAGCSGGGGETRVSQGAGSKLEPICQALGTFLSSEPGTPGKVTGFSFVMFDGSGPQLSCAGGNQTLAAVRPIASASKLASAAAILTLVDSGRLNLDLPVSLYLAGSGVNWPLDKLLVTMRQLLNHTSGLPGLVDDSSSACIEEETSMTLQECVAAIAATPLVGRPGEQFNYGGASYQVAGFIASRLAGASWEEFFQTAIGQPLGMSTFTYGNPARVTNPRIAGGAFTNADDYARLLRMIQAGGSWDGTQVLSARMVENLESDQVAGKPKAFSPVDAARFPGYAFGFFISDPSLHPGSAGPELSDPGLFGTTPWIDQDLGYGAVLLITRTTGVGMAMWDAVRPLAIAHFKGS